MSYIRILRTVAESLETSSSVALHPLSVCHDSFTDGCDSAKRGYESESIRWRAVLCLLKLNIFCIATVWSVLFCSFPSLYSSLLFSSPLSLFFFIILSSFSSLLYPPFPPIHPSIFPTPSSPFYLFPVFSPVITLLWFRR